MMNSTSHSHSRLDYSSVVWHESQVLEGVRYAIRRISLLQRLDLVRQVRELMLRYEFLKSGDAADELQANIAELEVQKLYIEWALDEIQGLMIDGELAAASTLIAKGPEALICEIVGAIRQQMELSEQERKNS